jgi:poly(A) polymerase
MSIEEDLSRRDFTMNAMAIKILPPPSHPFKGGDKGEVYLIDPFNGLKDLADKIIRAVGKPEERFHEDYTRLLRAVRFACQLNFLIEEKTWDVLKALSPRLNDTLPNSEEYIVSRETIGKELVQAFFYNPTRAFDLFDASGLMGALMPELLAMKNCPQPKEYHTEGDVWVHTRLALSALRSAAFKKEFRDNPKVDANLIVATLFHDLGKPLTIKTPERDKTDRIRFDGHDEQGARTARHLCNSLKLSQFPKSSPLHIGSEHLGWLIDNHLLLVTGKIEEMRPSTIEKYFFKDKALGDNLLKLAFADGLASILPKGEPALSLFYKMRKRIKELGKLDKKTNGLPPPLLSGGEIMELLNIPPSPQVGEIIAKLREAQLEGKIRTKREAISLLSQIKVKK